MKKKILCILLSLSMLTAMSPAAAFAGEQTQLAVSQEPAETVEPESGPQITFNLLPEFNGNEPEIQAARYYALGQWIISYARNPSLVQNFNSYFNMIWPDSIAPVTDLSMLPEAAKKEAALAIGSYLIGYARNPSYFTVNSETRPNEHMTKYGLMSKDAETGVYVLKRHDTASEAFQAGRAAAIGDLLISYSRNPSLYDGLINFFETALGERPDYSGEVPVSVRAGLIESAGKLAYAYVRNPSLVSVPGTNPSEKDMIAIFNRYSPVPLNELMKDLPSSPEIEEAQMRAIGYILAAISRNQSKYDDIMKFFNFVYPANSKTLNQLSPEGQRGAAEVIGAYLYAYARNTSSAAKLQETLLKCGLTEEAADTATGYRFVRQNIALPEVQEGRMTAIEGFTIAYARNPSLREGFVTTISEALGDTPEVRKPYSVPVKAAICRNMGRFMVAYSRNPSLSLQLCINLISAAGLSPCAGEGYTSEIKTVTDENGKETRTITLTAKDGYELSEYSSFDNPVNTFTYNIDIERGNLFVRKINPDDPSFSPEITMISDISYTHGSDGSDGNQALIPLTEESVKRVTSDTIELEDHSGLFTVYTCDGGKTWQNSNVFTNLKPETTYSFAAAEYIDNGFIPVVNGPCPEVKTKEAPVYIPDPLPPKPDQKVPGTADGNKGNAEVTEQDMNNIIENAGNADNKQVNIDVKFDKEVSDITVEIPKAPLEDLVSKTDVALNVTTPAGNITLKKEVLENAAAQAEGSTITIVVQKEDKKSEITARFGKDAVVTDVKIVSNGSEIHTFGDHFVTVTLPVPEALKDAALAVLHCSRNGRLADMNAKPVMLKGIPHITFDTSHFSDFVITDRETADRLLAEQKEADRIERLKEGVKSTKIKASSKLVKGGVRVTWKKSPGYRMDGYEVFRAVNKGSFGKKPYFKAKSATYKNTKSLKKGNRYYYKVRGYRIIDGEKVYSKWSNKAYRTIR